MLSLPRSSVAPGLRRRSWRLAALLLATLVLTVAGMTAIRAIAAKPEPWPAFTMVYKDTEQTGSGEVSQVFRITYTDSRHYTTVLLSHSTVPAAVGWTNVRDGDVSRTTDPRLGVVSESANAEDGLVPDYWLRPAPRAWFASRPGAITASAGNRLERASISWTLEDGRRSTETLTYRTEDGIPTLYTETIDGKEVHRIEMVELFLR